MPTGLWRFTDPEVFSQIEPIFRIGLWLEKDKCNSSSGQAGCHMEGQQFTGRDPILLLKLFMDLQPLVQGYKKHSFHNVRIQWMIPPKVRD